MRLKLRIGERIDGQTRVRVYDLHESYTQRIVQGLIDRTIESLRTEKPEPLRLLLSKRNRLELLPEAFERIETVAIMDAELSAPPPDFGEGPEAL